MFEEISFDERKQNNVQKSLSKKKKFEIFESFFRITNITPHSLP